MDRALRLVAGFGEDRGAAETSTIFAWIVVGVLVVMGLLGALQALGTDVIGWVRTQLGI